ncbi:flagellar hook-associated protein flgK [Candidatus Kuenenia stuttgartiensis]|uniref:Flagellar hook-associated protein 1 n=1 Tax=Kuenenia stuttgartiensis TaxID=174633 RepID=Q1Q2Q5_KUEST|nr:flagellar hook-associated protein FlgK [Candidatus Kuenenia stuttgartiensis]QII11407.1 flagellar hook-associated protein flgK [Candidatus Kuenenia stuttgartiensis]CAJ74305.1 similar to flagellar hook-associated protein FlgK [Candidatus Kuenenia stuttgartiensis]
MASSDIQIGMSGVLAAQRAMMVSAHNISNANTKGYTKQTVSLATRLPLQTTIGSIGQGVDLVKIMRQKDDYLNSRIRFVTSSLGASSIKSQQLRELETVFNELSDASISNSLTSFFKFVNDLSQDESTSSRSVLVEKAITMTESIRAIVDELGMMKEFVKQSVESKLNEVNGLAKDIVDLNKEIHSLQTTGGEPNDLLDKRETLLGEISKFLDVTTRTQKNGMIDVMIAGGVLVSGSNALTLESRVDSSGKLNITSYGSSKHKPTGGELSGLLEMYNNTLPAYDAKLDTFATALIKKFNAIHSEGVGTDGGFTTVLGTNKVTDATKALNTAGLGLPFAPSSGDIYVTVINTSTGEEVKNKITVDVANDSLTKLSADIDGITNLSSAISDGKLQITADSGYKFNFSYALDPNPGDLGASTVSLSGVYSGSSNDTYTFEALGTGTIGTTSGLQVEVRDSGSNLIATLDVGEGYTPGNTLAVANGVSVSFSAGAVASGNTLTGVDVINDSDKTDLLAALGINTFFSGKDASDIDVEKRIREDVTLIATSIGESGDNTNALRLSALQNDNSIVGNTTLSDYLHQIAAALGEEANSAYKSEEKYTALEGSLQNRREEVSGVNIDEELVTLIRFQQAYQASAKYISTVDRLINTLLNSL